jgi:opacity protein-like surface antigen
MPGRIAFSTICLMLAAASASAQRTEGSVNVGYGAAEGISSAPRFLLGQFYDTADIDSGSSYNATLGFFVSRNLEVEFLFSRQNSHLSADGPGLELPIARLTIDNYMGNVVYNWGDEDFILRPFVFGGLGATQYSFGEFLLPQPLHARPFRIDDSTTRFSSAIGGGVKFYFSRYVGARATVRVTPTYITSSPGGTWCDPFYGCWPIVDNHYSTQVDSSVGVTFRF